MITFDKSINNKMKPESLMMSHGYKPELSQGAVKCPVFLTSTFVFQTAEEGKDFLKWLMDIENQDQMKN